ncbi:DUF1446 domain-containing protein [soil metagenome]
MTEDGSVRTELAPLRIGNASGFYGDRFSAVSEMLTGGSLDVLTGDYLAELTMLILGRDRLADPTAGYAKTFLRQMEQCLGLALQNSVRIVVNAGGLNPAGLAGRLRDLADRLGLPAVVAHVDGDDLLPRAAELGFAERGFTERNSAASDSAASGHTASGHTAPLTANAYLGGWGIAHCLKSGADLVVTGRVTDASLVLGPAAAHFGWQPDDLDALAGAVTAGHLIECGAQVTGGNYALFTELDLDSRPLGFPIAEIHSDGSSVITKHPGTGGAVTVGTVTAQLLYEIGGARYAGPDVTTRIDTAVLTQQGPDRVRVSGVRGEPPPPTLKVSLNYLGGFRNQVEFVLTGLDLPQKAELARQQFSGALTAGRSDGRLPFALEWTASGVPAPDADTEESASMLLRCAVRCADPDPIGRPFSNAAVELALASYPGFHLTAPPGKAQPYGVFQAGFVAATEVTHRAVTADGLTTTIPATATTQQLCELPEPELPPWRSSGVTRRVPLGTVVGARSGDKGGSANIGVWARDAAAWPWLAHTLTVDLLRELLPETAELAITRHVLPQLRAVNFVIESILGSGVASNARFDPQAKALGEWLRARFVDIDEELL